MQHTEKAKHAFLGLCLAVILPGCTITYPAIARYEDGREKFSGIVDASVFGGGDVTLVSASSGVECPGRAESTSVGLTCAGQTGTIHLQCSDGRVLLGNWTATSCTTGAGRGRDQDDRKFEFAFGLTEDEVKAFLAE